MERITGTGLALCIFGFVVLLGSGITGSGLALCRFGYDDAGNTSHNSNMIPMLTMLNEKYKDCDVALMKAYRGQDYNMTEIGNYCGVSFWTVSRSISSAVKCKT